MSRPLDDEWRAWLKLNLERGCDVRDLFERARRQDFDPDDIAAELNGFKPGDTPPSRDGDMQTFWRERYDAPLTKVDNQPRAWRLDTDLAQIYEVPDILTADECAAMMEVIDLSLRPSTTTRGPADYRTSRTCDMRRADPATMDSIDDRLAQLIGPDVSYSEPIQGQRYDVGEYFKAHTDWFAPNTNEFEVHTKVGGQRTWTVMVYLNAVAAGGETTFEKVGRSFKPVPGTAVAWNNLNADGSTNPYVLHEAMPVLDGRKYVITKWFRERPGLNV